jgi:hypothetical protein
MRFSAPGFGIQLATERNRKECDLAPAESAGIDVPTTPGIQPDADVTARLLRALTALYIQRSDHTAEEQQQYTELALRLIDKTGTSTHAAVAIKLQRYPAAPAVIMARLGDAQFSPDDPRGSAQHQHSLTDPLVKNIPSHADYDADRASVSTSDPPAPASTVTQPASMMPEFGEAFFSASPPERLRMLSLVSDAGSAETAPENGRRFHVRSNVAAWRGRAGAFAREFEQLIDAPTSVCERILNDLWGEPLVIAAKATGMPVAVLQRILLLVSPATNHSVARVYELTELYHDLDIRTARDLLAVWRNAARPDDEQMTPAPITDLRARFGVLTARIRSQSVISRPRRGSGAPRGLRSR